MYGRSDTVIRKLKIASATVLLIIHIGFGCGDSRIQCGSLHKLRPLDLPIYHHSIFSAMLCVARGPHRINLSSQQKPSCLRTKNQANMASNRMHCYAL